MKEFKIIIAGSRGFNDYNLLSEKLNTLLKNKIKEYTIVVISGGARGADTLGEVWAAKNKHEFKRFPADWDKYGKKAGYIRNEQMANVADVLVAFWDGVSKGTSNMIDIMNKLNKPVRVVRF
jgi:hypothetical protein